jgi:hypothetical protein
MYNPLFFPANKKALYVALSSSLLDRPDSVKNSFQTD